MLTFDPDSHTYKYDGGIVPSVTQVIGEYIKGRRWCVNIFTSEWVERDMLEAGGDRGTAIHTACGFLINGHDLIWEELSPDLVHPLREFQSWLSEWKPEVIVAEEAIYSRKYGYAGTSDLIAKIQGEVAVIDYKSGAHLMAGPQTAGYEELYRENHKYKKAIKRWVLHLPKTGSYRFEPMTNKMDWDFFRSRLFQYQYLQARANPVSFPPPGQM